MVLYCNTLTGYCSICSENSVYSSDLHPSSTCLLGYCREDSASDVIQLFVVDDPRDP